MVIKMLKDKPKKGKYCIGGVIYTEVEIDKLIKRILRREGIKSKNNI